MEVQLGNAHGTLGDAEKMRSFNELALSIQAREHGPNHHVRASHLDIFFKK